jgi:ketosteroid isomerase-like protein
MSQENVEIVRTPLRMGERSRRTLDERLALRFPRLVDTFTRRIGRLPTTSRIRRSILARSTRLAAEAFNRRDAEAFLIAFHREGRYQPARISAEVAASEDSFPAHQGLKRFWEDGDTSWGRLRVEAHEMIDAGDRTVMLGRAVGGQGVLSGIPLESPFATVSILLNGKVIHLREYLTHAEALEALGLSE